MGAEELGTQKSSQTTMKRRSQCVPTSESSTPMDLVSVFFLENPKPSKKVTLKKFFSKGVFLHLLKSLFVIWIRWKPFSPRRCVWYLHWIKQRGGGSLQADTRRKWCLFSHSTSMAICSETCAPKLSLALINQLEEVESFGLDFMWSNSIFC